MNLIIIEGRKEKTLIYNNIKYTDKHNGNWGFLLNKQTNEIKFSLIYDYE